MVSKADCRRILPCSPPPCICLVRFPTLNPGTGLSNLTAPTYYDRALGRPPRVSQFNVAVQREVISGMTLEAAYVGNRGAWLQAN